MGISPSDKIYIAGHRGLMGSAFVRMFESSGYGNLLLRSREELDLRDREPVRDLFSKNRPDIVVIGAGCVGGIQENLDHGFELLRDNLLVQTNIILSAQEFGARKVVYLGSSCMYPRVASQPMAEETLLSGKPEESSLPYAMAKLAGLHLCLAYNRQNPGKVFLPVIPNSTYGPNDDFSPGKGHVLSALITRFHEAKSTGVEKVVLWGTGSPRREFIYSDDVASAVLHLLEKNPDLEFPANIGVGEDVSIRELAEMVRSAIGYEGAIQWDTSKPDGAPRKLLDSSRFLKTGWNPTVSLREGIEKTYRWFLEDKEARS